MTLRRTRSIVKSHSKQQKQRQREQQRRSSRKLLTEQLEDRRLLAGPELIAIRPDDAALLQPGDTLHTAPREFNLLFKGGADLDEATIANNVRLVRSGGDGLFGNGNDVTVSLGFLGLNDPGDTDTANLQSIVLRPASSASHNVTDPRVALPDDTYRIRINGVGGSPLRNRTAEPFEVGGVAGVFTQSFRLARGAQVVAVVPQPISRNSHLVTFGGTVTGGQFTLRFEGRTTLPINATVGNVRQNIEDGLNALNNVQPGDLVVTGPASGGPWTVELQGQYAGEEPVLALGASGLTGSNTSISVIRQAALRQATNQIIVYFSDDELDPADAVDPKFYRLVDTSASAALGDDAITLPTNVTYDPVDNTAALTFAAIPDGTYRIEVGTADEANSPVENALDIGTLFSTTGFQYNGYVGDDDGVTSSNQSDRDLYRFSVAAGSQLAISAASRAAGFNVDVKLFAADGTTLIAPNSSVEGGAGGTDTLNFTSIAGSGFVTLVAEVSSELGGGGAGSFLLSITPSGAAGSIANTEPIDTTFVGATQLGTLGIAGAKHSSAISAQSIAMPEYPGGEDEPGHRLIQPEQHLPSFGLGPSVPGAITVSGYNFPASVGGYPNFISETEKQVVREIYEIYGSYIGRQFIEGGGTAIMKGDLKASTPTDISGPGGVAGRGGAGLVVLDFADFPLSNNVFGSAFFGVMFHEIGHSLGLNHSYDLPTVQGSGVPNEVYPGDYDIVHLQRLWRPDSTDIDLYQFNVTEPGYFTAETVAERRTVTSNLDSVLKLYRQNADGTREVISQNDNYFSNDSFIGLDLEVGTYFVGVSSTGNVDYDPNIADSGFGGRTDGGYDLSLSLKPSPRSTVADRDGDATNEPGTLFDGDADGEPGGQYSFWFESSANTIFVDKANDQRANIVDGNGQLTGTTGNPATGPYDTISFAMQQAANRIMVPSNRAGVATVVDGDTFIIDDGLNPTLTFEFNSAGGLTDPLTHVAVPFTVGDSAATVATAIATAINNAAINMSGGTMPMPFQLDQQVDATVGGVGNIVVTLTGIINLDMRGSTALLNAPNLVRIVGNSGLDGNIKTLADAQPYLVGLNNAGSALTDGQSIEVPQGVTAMIDAGTLLKLRKGSIDAGTSSALVDRRSASVQILGTPENKVFFRSYRDDTVGGNSDGVGPAAASGDYGGIVLREDSDLEQNGIFLNYVNHADMNNGGGKVFVGSNEEAFAPIHMIVARPTVSFNTITSSFGALMSANPNSFDDAGLDECMNQITRLGRPLALYLCVASV